MELHVITGKLEYRQRHDDLLGRFFNNSLATSPMSSVHAVSGLVRHLISPLQITFIGDINTEKGKKFERIFRESENSDLIIFKLYEKSEKDFRAIVCIGNVCLEEILDPVLFKKILDFEIFLTTQ